MYTNLAYTRQFSIHDTLKYTWVGGRAPRMVHEHANIGVHVYTNLEAL